MKENKPALVVHGHFYQPPRENPWTGKIDRQPGASPHHDWNERIYDECYRPNAYARIHDGSGAIERIINTYSLASFNFGPTLLSWFARQHPEILTRLLDADRESVRTHGGHGNAIAQAYGHAILPLCNSRDLRTQVRWGVGEFRHRFRREPESLWLPETACNAETLKVLIEEGMKFIILSPYQGARIRPIGSEKWESVESGAIDPKLPYAWFHPDGSGRSLAIFFYHGVIAHAVAFEGILQSSAALVDRFANAGARTGQLVSVATDGETYGHHFRLGERCLAHALSIEAPRRGFWVTNFGEFLEHHPPTLEVELADGPGGEGTSWSCAHGVGRWYRDCGCRTGGTQHSNQCWRTPLRKALDYLRDDAARLFESTRGSCFEDPWMARDAYVSLLVGGPTARDEFLRRHTPRDLSRADRERALKHLELQKNALLMYTSCGWFYSDLSGLETLQVLSYAERALELMASLGVNSAPVRAQFLAILSEARSNVPEMGNGADIFRKLVGPCRVSPERFAAHLSIASLVDSEESTTGFDGYRLEKRSFKRLQHGRLTLATSRFVVESTATGEVLDYAAVAMHLGELDFHAVVKPYPGDDAFNASTGRLWRHFLAAPLPLILRIAQEEFGLDEFGLEHALLDVRQKIVGSLFGSLIKRLCQEVALLYEDNKRTIEMLRVNGFELPGELRAAAEFGLGRQFEDEIRRQTNRDDPTVYQKAVEIAQEASRRGYRIDRTFSSKHFDELITESVRRALAEPTPDRFRSPLELLKVSRLLLLEPSLERAQESMVEALSPSSPVSAPMRELALALGLSATLVPAPIPPEKQNSDVSLARSLTR